MLAHLASIIYIQLIASITLLKALSFASLILSTMQLLVELPLFSLSLSLSLSLSTAIHSTPLTTLFFSIVSLPVLASWVPLTIGLSLISPTGLFRHLRFLFLFIIHLAVFQKLCHRLILFTIYVSPIASIVINSHMLTIHSFFSYFPQNLYLSGFPPAVYLLSSQLYGSFTMVWL